MLFVVIVSDVNVSSHWRGYLAIWFSESSTANDEMPGLANCKSLPKVRNFFYYSWNSLGCLEFLAISNSNHLPVDVVFQSFAIGYLETPAIWNHFSFPQRVRNAGLHCKWFSSGCDLDKKENKRATQAFWYEFMLLGSAQMSNIAASRSATRLQ